MSLNAIGVFGGMGPLASAKFIETIYTLRMKKTSYEQELPKIFLYSDPSFPDRTDYLLKGKEAVLLQKLCEGLDELIKHEVEKIIICCFTVHHLFPQLPKRLQEKIISLPFLLLEEIIKCAQPVLLLCTKGTKILKIFEAQKNWEKASDYVVQVSDSDQVEIHKNIYEMKRFGLKESINDFVLSMMSKYNTRFWAAGCTEFHLLAAHQYHFCVSQACKKKAIDPLITIAEKLSM